MIDFGSGRRFPYGVRGEEEELAKFAIIRKHAIAMHGTDASLEEIADLIIIKRDH